MATRPIPRQQDALDQAFYTLYSQVAPLYQAPERYYHDRRHLDSLLFQLHEQLGTGRQTDAERYDYQVIRMAILYHDAYYQPLTPIFNEAQSAALFRHQFHSFADRAIAPGVISQYFVGDVMDAIMATSTHTEVPVFKPKHAIRWVLDLDLHEMGTDKYLHNRKMLMREAAASGPLDPIDYVHWLLHFLVKMLNKPRIFHTDAMHAKYEEVARINLRRDYEHMWRVLWGGVKRQPSDGPLVAPTQADVEAFRSLGEVTRLHVINGLLRWPGEYDVNWKPTA